MGRLPPSTCRSTGTSRPRDHSLDWSVSDDELLTWFADRARGLAASLYGRRLYELMSAYWPTAGDDPAATEPMRVTYLGYATA